MFLPSSARYLFRSNLVMMGFRLSISHTLENNSMVLFVLIIFFLRTLPTALEKNSKKSDYIRISFALHGFTVSSVLHFTSMVFHIFSSVRYPLPSRPTLPSQSAQPPSNSFDPLLSLDCYRCYLMPIQHRMGSCFCCLFTYVKHPSQELTIVDMFHLPYAARLVEFGCTLMTTKGLNVTR